MSAKTNSLLDANDVIKPFQNRTTDIHPLLNQVGKSFYLALKSPFQMTQLLPICTHGASKSN